jgi:hypothetical protein
MPIYCFTNEETGETVEELFPMGECPEEIQRPVHRADDGPTFVAMFKRNMGAEGPGRGFGPDNPGWPIECIASGVNANQADELRTFYKERGIDCEVTRHGNPVYRDELHKRKCLKARGFRDNNSFV